MKALVCTQCLVMLSLIFTIIHETSISSSQGQEAAPLTQEKELSQEAPSRGDREDLFSRLVNTTLAWPSSYRDKLQFSMHDIWYPEVGDMSPGMLVPAVHAPCAGAPGHARHVPPVRHRETLHPRHVPRHGEGYLHGH